MGSRDGTSPRQSSFSDVWVTRSAADGWSIFGSQNVAFYDCGITDNARDGIYFDMGTGGHDFFNFYERGSLRYGIRCDQKSPGGGFMYLHRRHQLLRRDPRQPPRTGGGVEGPSWTGARVGLLRHGHRRHQPQRSDDPPGPDAQRATTGSSRCRIWATPKGTNPGNACIQISGVVGAQRPAAPVPEDRRLLVHGRRQLRVRRRLPTATTSTRAGAGSSTPPPSDR